MWIDTKIEHRQENKSKRCIILIPAYKPDSLKDFAVASIMRAVKVLGEKYEIALLCPFGLNVDYYDKIANYNFSHLRCNEEYFKNRRQYSNLCEVWEFYDACREYEYMLIYQYDAWVFEDKLEYFMNKGWDYVGAPHICIKGKPTEVGNGGLSLRKIDKFIKICKETNFKQSKLMEDRFWGNILKDKMNLPSIEEAYEFSIQDNVELGFEVNGGKLPFGCHQPQTHKWEIWNEHIKYGKI